MASEPLKAVVDTNVVVSASLQRLGIPASILAAGIEGKFTLCFSPNILAEYREVLTRGKFALPAKLVESVMADIERAGEQCSPSATISVCSDIPDNKFLECAEAANARYLVTGNTRHFPPHYGVTQVVTPRDFATILLSEGIL